MTRREIAKMLGVSVETVRKWEKVFRAHFTTPPGKRGQGVKRVLNDNDVTVLRAIHQLRGEGVPLSEVGDKIPFTVALLEATPEPEPDPQVSETDKALALSDR